MAERPNAANRPVVKRPLADTNSVISKPATEKGMKSFPSLMFLLFCNFYHRIAAAPLTLLSPHSSTGILQALTFQAQVLGGKY